MEMIKVIVIYVEFVFVWNALIIVKRFAKKYSISLPFIGTNKKHKGVSALKRLDVPYHHLFSVDYVFFFL